MVIRDSGHRCGIPIIIVKNKTADTGLMNFKISLSSNCNF